MPDATWQCDGVTLYLGDCLDILREMPDNSIDALVTDPPAGIGFMGKEWDTFGRSNPRAQQDRDAAHDRYGKGALPYGFSGSGRTPGDRDRFVAFMIEVMRECLRVLKPGAHALVWALPRTSHWTGWALEEAGFEVRDRIAHLFGSGFPKSANVSKMLDKMAGVERPDAIKGGHMGISTNGGDGRNANAQAWHTQEMHGQINKGSWTIGTPISPAAIQWQGWGTSLKPAMENWYLVQKPLDILGYCGIINSNLGQVENELCKQNANDAAESLQPIRVDSSEGMTDSVPANVLMRQEVGQESRIQIGGEADSLPVTAMSESESVTNMCLSIVGSWSSILAELSQAQSKYTTEMATGLITDLRTLSYWTSRITAEVITQAVLGHGGARSFVLSVDGLFNGALRNLIDTQTLSALESAISAAPLPSKRVGNLPLDELGQSKELSPNEWGWWLCRKPLTGTVAANVLEWGTGAINVDGCRVPTNGDDARAMARCNTPGSGRMYASRPSIGTFGRSKPTGPLDTSQGRWPANVTHDGSEEVIKGFPVTTSNSGNLTHSNRNRPNGIYGIYGAGPTSGISDSGSAARFFYCAKASRQDREEGCEGLEQTLRRTHGDTGPCDNAKPNGQGPISCHNGHPTVKATPLMRWLCRLITPPGGTVLDPFMGSGSTGKACALEGFNFIGIELDPEYFEIAKRRIEQAMMQPRLEGV